MKVILLKNIKKLGLIGDEIIVKNGYARNYLLPKKFVQISTEDRLRYIEKRKQIERKKYEELKGEAKGLAEKLVDITCVIKVEVNEVGKMYGSVTEVRYYREFKRTEY